MFENSKRVFRLFIVGLIFIVAFVISCGSHRSAGAGSKVADEQSSDSSNRKIEVEAYLFDAKFRRKGKPTSFRLELFQTDSVIGMYGRGYVGKGILKGTLTHDSLTLLFPTTGEYLMESTSSVLVRLPCRLNGPSLDIFNLFTTLPDSMNLDSAVIIVSDYGNMKKPEFSLSLSGCEWEINLKYDSQKSGWRLKQFDYQSGDNTSLKATRREYRRSAKVKSDRLKLKIPDTAVRIER